MAVKMQKEYGDALNTVFVESQGHKLPDIQKLALKRKWLGSSAMWTTERPFTTGARGIPNFVLLSPEGKVVLKGNPISMHKQVEDYLKSLKRRRIEVPGNLPKKLHGAFKDLHKGKLADALADTQKLAQDADLADAAKKLAAEVDTQAKAAVARVGRAIDAGAFSYAKQLGKKFGKVLKGSPHEKTLEEQLAKLKDAKLADAIKAEKDLSKIERTLYSKGPAKSSKLRLTRLANKYPDTPAGKLAAELAAALE